MKKYKVLPDYNSTVGQLSSNLENNIGSEVGNPDKMADIIIKVANEDKPPLRLPLGKDAYNLALENDSGRIRELIHWKNLSKSSNYD